MQTDGSTISDTSIILNAAKILRQSNIDTCLRELSQPDEWLSDVTINSFCVSILEINLNKLRISFTH